MAPARSRKEANDQLTAVRNNFHGSDRVIQNLERATGDLSDQLYENPGHFVFELVQNSDDAAFDPQVAPTLTFTLTHAPEYILQVECNELGFSFEEVDAICGIGKSTKRQIVDGKRVFTGEKGLGFKSVFSVANVVEIYSGFYTFKFDRNESLGMIKPILHPGQDPRPHNGTKMIIRLKGEESYARVQKELVSMDSQILLFLRKIRKLAIVSLEKRISFSVAQASPTTKTIYERDDHERYKDFHSFDFLVSNMPYNQARNGVQQTVVQLAFPVGNDANPETSGQRTYAYLPIANYGWKFAMNVDLLLTSSRESFDESLEWNQALRIGMAKAAAGAMVQLSQMPKFRYTWFHWLQRVRTPSAFWNSLEADIFGLLKTRNMFETLSPDTGLMPPCDVLSVDPKFRLDDKLVVDRNPQQKAYLSFAYDEALSNPTTNEVLRQLGVEEMTTEIFLGVLQSWLDGNDCAQKGQPWLVKIAEAFKDADIALLEQVKKLSIIPLEDGSWENAHTVGLYVESNVVGDRYQGNEIRVIDSSATQQDVLRTFYRRLGLEYLYAQRICEEIIDRHAELTLGNFNTLLTGNYVHDILFLFANWRHASFYAHQNKKKWKDLKFVTGRTRRGQYGEPQKLLKGSHVYIGKSPNVSALIMKHCQNPMSGMDVLDGRYFETFEKGNQDPEEIMEMQTEFEQWLRDDCHLRLFPVLTYPADHQHTTFRLTREAEFLFKNDPEGILKELCDRQGRHFKDRRTQECLDKMIRDTEFLCTDGKSRPLWETAWDASGSRELHAICPDIPYLSLSEGNPGYIPFLSRFGVTMKPTVKARTKQYLLLPDLPEERTLQWIQHMQELYEDLGTMAHDKRAKSNDIFRAVLHDDFQVYIPSTKQWKHPGLCVWKAEMKLQETPILANLYPTCESLFKTYLQVRDASVRDYVQEAENIARKGDGTLPGRVIEFLKRINKVAGFNATDEVQKNLQSLWYKEIWPVLTVGHDSNQASKKTWPGGLLRGTSSFKWYIPDHTTLQDQFRGRIQMLDIHVSDVSELAPLIKYLEYEPRLLSLAAKTEVRPVEPIVDHRDLTIDLRLKLKNFLIVIGEEFRDRAAMISNLSVRIADSLPAKTVIDGVKAHPRLENVGIVENCDPLGMDIFVFKGLKQRRVMPEICRKVREQLNVKDERHREFLLTILLSPLEDFVAIMGEFGLDSGVSDKLSLSSPLDKTLSLKSMAEDESLKKKSEEAKASIGEIQSLMAQHPSLGLEQSLELHERIGKEGEKHVNDHLAKNIPDWSIEDNWTSHYRKYYGYSDFTMEANFADFTYTDKSGHMARLLRSMLGPQYRVGSYTRYHLEVKTTTEGCMHGFHLSGRQLDLAKRFRLKSQTKQTDVYVIVRVYDLNGAKKMRVCLDPLINSAFSVLDGEVMASLC